MSFIRNQLAMLGKWGRNSDESLGRLDIRQDQLLQDFPGPAFIADEGYQIHFYNEAAKTLITALHQGAEGTFQEALQKGCRSNGPSLQTASLERVGSEAEVYDLTFLPLDDIKGRYLVTAKNVSLQRNLTNALVASRQLFKDLVTCTAEFVFETDEAGQFRYVSPRGGMGYSAAELDGMAAQSLLLGDGNSRPTEFINPFSAPKALSDQLIWLRSKSNALVSMRVTSIPLFDDDGKWKGSRGAGRDVTEEMARVSKMERLAAQEEVLSSIVNAIRTEIDPEKLFALAGKGACEALNSSRFVIARREASGHLATVFEEGADPDIHQFLNSWFDSQNIENIRSGELVREVFDKWKFYISPLGAKGEIDGFFALIRTEDALEIDDEESHLLRHLGDHLEVALIQIKARERLIELTRTDELSGLLNRRAFHQDVTKRIAHGKRTKNKNALFYVDLDNFKPVNDRFGHEKGDDVLKAVSQLLDENSRVGDLVARLGGDEFAIWFENMTEEKAIEKADELQSKCAEVSVALDVIDPALSFSIGIVCATGEKDEDLEGLLAIADSAMYQVKAKGKGSYHLSIKEMQSQDDTRK